MAEEVNDKLIADIIRNESRRATILELYKISIANLISSQILYNNKQYPDTILLLEQSVEKLTKAMQLYIGLITTEELGGHYPIITYRRNTEKKVLPMFQKIEEIKASDPKTTKIFNAMDEIFPERPFSVMLADQKDKLTKFVEGTKHIKSSENQREIALMGEGDIDAMLGTIYKFPEDKPKAEATVKSFIESEQFDELMKRMKEGIIKLVEELAKTDNTIEVTKVKEEVLHLDDSKLREFFKVIMDFIMSITIPLLSLQYLSILLSPHTESTRYPNNDAKIITTEIYNENLGIVKAYPRIVTVVKYNIDCLGELFSKLEQG